MSQVQETLERAIQTFYHSENSDERNASHQWLLQLQKSPEGWQVLWLLLDSQKSVEVQYYGAIILHFKISHNLNDINHEELSKLKTKFQELLAMFCNGSKIVLSKLCSSYSAFIMQVADEGFTLLQCVQSIENYFKSVGLDAKFVVLELLNALPTEFKMLNLNSNQKINARKLMNEFISLILSLCKNVLEQPSPNQSDRQYQNDTLSCLLSWVEFGISIVNASDLMPVLFSNIPVEEISDRVCEVLHELISSPTSYSLDETIFKVLQQVLSLEVLVNETISNENHGLINNLCLLYSSLGETHCRLFLKTTDSEKQLAMFNLVKGILKFTSMKGNYPVDETCSELTFNFWYTLYDDIFSLDEISKYHEQFCDAYLMLLDVFFVKCQYPGEDIYSKFTSDEKEMLRCYRIDIQDTMLYVCMLLKEKCLMYFSQKIIFLLSDSSSQWQQYEAVFHLLRGATESIDSEESVYLPTILPLLQKIPKHPKILDSLVLFLGGLSEWLNSHPNQIVHVLPFLLEGIGNSDTSVSCSISLKDLCHECALLFNEGAIMEVLQTCHKELHNQSTPLKVVVRLFEIGGYVISALHPYKIEENLNVLIAPLFQWFKHVLLQNSVTLKSKKKIVHYLNCFYGLFRALDPFEEQTVHPVAALYGQLIPLFRFLKAWCGFEEVADAATSCITKALEVTREKLGAHVSVTLEVIADFFVTQPFGCVLDAASVLIGMFGAEKDYTERVKNLFSLLSSSCVSMVESGEGKSHPDCMQSFMELATRTIKSVPEFIYHDDEKQLAIIKSALILLTFQETPTIKSTCNFIMTYINFSSSYDGGKIVIEAVGRDIVIQSLLCIGGVSPRHTTDHFADILLSLNKNFITLLAVWLNELLNKDDFPTLNPTKLQKEHFQKAILREKKNKRRIKDMVRDFALVCRGLHGMSYAQ